MGDQKDRKKRVRKFGDGRSTPTEFVDIGGVEHAVLDMRKVRVGMQARLSEIARENRKVSLESLVDGATLMEEGIKILVPSLVDYDLAGNFSFGDLVELFRHVFTAYDEPEPEPTEAPKEGANPGPLAGSPSGEAK